MATGQITAGGKMKPAFPETVEVQVRAPAFITARPVVVELV
jgi:hypothetical protein